MNDYFQQKQDLILVDKKGRKCGKEEKWKTHKKGLLHKGFSIALFYKKRIILQKRKHLVFDKTIDFTASSHPIFINKKPENEKQAVFKSLKREWNINKKDLKNFKNLGSFVYKASDKNNFIEHEFCTVYRANINNLPIPNFCFAYGFELVGRSFLKENQDKFLLTPWLKKFLNSLSF